jgi:hypothetical protein
MKTKGGVESGKGASALLTATNRPPVPTLAIGGIASDEQNIKRDESTSTPHQMMIADAHEKRNIDPKSRANENDSLENGTTRTRTLLQ